jgi:hypothetical protein
MARAAKAKKFDLTPLDKDNWSSAKIEGKFRGLVERTGLRSYRLYLGKNDVTNFTSRKSLETWLTEKWAS